MTKRKILKAARKTTLYTAEQRKEWHWTYPKYAPEDSEATTLKKKTVNLEFYTQQKHLLRMKAKIKIFSDLQKLIEFIIDKPALQEVLKSSRQEENNIIWKSWSTKGMKRTPEMVTIWAHIKKGFFLLFKSL